MAVIPLTNVTLKAAKTAATLLKSFKSSNLPRREITSGSNPLKNQVFNKEKKKVIHNFHKIFTEQQRRPPVKNEFDKLLAPAGGNRITKTKTLVEGLPFFKGVTFEKSQMVSKLGKANLKPGGRTPEGVYTKKYRARQNLQGSATVDQNVYSVTKKNYPDLIDDAGKTIVPGYKGKNISDFSHASDLTTPTTSDVLQVAPSRLNRVQMNEAGAELRKLTQEQNKLIKGKTPKQLKELRARVDAINVEKSDIIMGIKDPKIKGQLKTELVEINNRGVVSKNLFGVGGQQYKIDQFNLIPKGATTRDFDPRIDLTPAEQVTFRLGKNQALQASNQLNKTLTNQAKTPEYQDGGKVESMDDIIRKHFEIGGIVGKNSSFGSVGGSGSRIGNIGQDNEVGTIQSMLAGIGAGIIDIPKGAFSLGASLVDLGLGTNHAAKVEKFFDNLTTLDEKAEATTAGNLTRIITNLGIPGTQAFKLGSKLTKQALVAKKKGQYFKLSDKKMEARMQDALNVNGRLLTTAGGAAGIGVSDAIFVGDPEQVGTIGDMFGGGPTALNPNNENNAGREVMNRMKFGLESSLFAGIIGATGSAIKTAMKRSNELDGNNKTIEYVLSKLRPRGAKPQEFFDLERGQIGIRQADVNRAQEIQRGVDKHIDALFPQLKNTFNKTTQKTRSKLLEELNETLLSGNANIDGLTGKFKFGEMDPKLVARDTARLKELGAKNPKAIFDSFYDMRVEWDEMFTALGTRMDPKLRKEFGSSFGKKMSDYLGSTYQIFQNTGSKLIANFKPGQEALDKAASLFKQADAESKGFKTIKEAETAGKALSDEQADYYVNNIIKTATPPRGLSTGAEKTAGIMFRAPSFFLNKTVMDDLEFKGIIKLSDVTDESKKVIEDLLGKINDPTQTILGGTARLSMLTRRNQFFDDLVKSSDEAIVGGKKGFFYDEEIDAINAFGRDNVKKVNMDPNKTLEAGTTNPINGKFAHKGVADALEETSQNILGEGALASVYNNFILYPKAASQLAKTVLSPVTHFRNFISAGAFAAGNGIIPNVDAFQTAFKSLQVPLKGAREQNDFYRKLLKLGVVNSNVRLGDLQRLLSDVQFGASASTIPGLRRLAKQGAKLKKGAEEFYTAEDDFWKITSFAMERQRYDQAYKKLVY